MPINGHCKGRGAISGKLTASQPEFTKLGPFAGVSNDGVVFFEMETCDPAAPFAGDHGITPDHRHLYLLPSVFLGRNVDGIDVHMTPTQLIGMLSDGRWFIAPVELLYSMEEDECGL